MTMWNIFIAVTFVLATYCLQIQGYLTPYYNPPMIGYNPYYPSQYYNNNPVQPNTRFYNQHSYPPLPPIHEPAAPSTEATTTTTTTTTVPTTTQGYDLDNIKFLCSLTGNWNLQVKNGWLQMHCKYDYFDLLQLLHYNLNNAGFLQNKEEMDDAWLISSSIFHRDGFVSVCTVDCDPGTWPIIINDEGINADLKMRSYLNIGCENMTKQHCEPICEPDIRNVENGQVTCTKGLFFESECELQCDFGYSASDVTTKKCNSGTRAWSDMASPFKCEGYDMDKLLLVVQMFSTEDDQLNIDLTNRTAVLDAILTNFLSSNKTKEEIYSDQENLVIKNQVLGKIIQAMYNDTEEEQTSSIVLKSLIPSKVRCKTSEPNLRLECGYPGIRRKECIDRGCCYDDRTMGAKWCFQPHMGTRDTVKDSTTRQPQGMYNDHIRVTSRSPSNPLTSIATFGGGEALYNYLMNHHRLNNYTPFPEIPNSVNINNNNHNRPNGNNNNANPQKDSVIPLKGGNSVNFQSQCRCTGSSSRTLTGCNNLGGEYLSRVICGIVTVAEEWPWHAIVYYKSRLCGGTLIANNYVVTAGHCVISKKNGKDDTEDRNKVILGASDITRETGVEQSSQIEKIYRHPRFFQSNNGRVQNDIAIIKLKTSMKITDNVRPICLPGSRKPASGHRCFVTGFGKKDNTDNPSQKLRYAELPIFETNKCLAMFNADNDASTVLCAGTLGEKSADTCKGDSGGPLFCTTDFSKPRSDMCAWYLAGVTSFGQEPCGQGFPGVYASVTHFEPWIRSIIST